MFRDTQYETSGGAKQQMDRGFVMRARIATDAANKVIPKGEVPWHRLHSNVHDVLIKTTPCTRAHSTGIHREGSQKGQAYSFATRQLKTAQKMSRHDSDYHHAIPQGKRVGTTT